MTIIRKYFPLIVRLSLGSLFIYAGVIKISDPVAFAGSVAAYKMLSYFPSYLVAAVLPWIEVVCGVLLVTGKKVQSAALLILLLDLVFMVALLSAMYRGLDIDCGCFRQGGTKTPAWIAFVRDMGIMAMALLVLKSCCSESAEQP